MDNAEIVEKVKAVTAQLLQEEGVELVEIIFRREGPGMVLRFLVDKPSGITLNECAFLNSEISRILDEQNIIDQYFILEVSSPGLDRPFKTRRDFERAVGQMVILHMYEMIEGHNNFKAKILEVKPQMVIVEREKDLRIMEIPLENIAKAKLKVEF
jgi:ribosome maturation factor RimP